MDSLIGQLIGQAVGAAIGSLLGALVVQVVCKVVLRFKPRYGIAYIASLLGYLGAVFVGSMIKATLDAVGKEPDLSTSALLFAAAFVVQASVYSQVISHPDRESIGFSSACMISFIQFVFGGLVMAVLLFIKANA